MGADVRRQTGAVERLVERVRGIAHSCGYAVAVHGSQRRDLDLIAVPWTHRAFSNTALINMLCERGPFLLGSKCGKPHGRIGYVLHGVPGSTGLEYIDLSVTPRNSVASDEEQQR